jgi:hypothetical protein
LGNNQIKPGKVRHLLGLKVKSKEESEEISGKLVT